MKFLPACWFGVLTALTTLVGCTSHQTKGNDGTSQLASLVIGQFNDPTWTEVEVILKPTSGGGGVDKTIASSSFSNQSATIGLQVAYGSYTVNAIYKDAANKLLFQVCPDTLAKVYTFNQPQVAITLPICATTSSASAGSVAVSTPPAPTPAATSTSTSTSAPTVQSAPPVASPGNPFSGALLVVDPHFVSNLQATAQQTAAQATAFTATAASKMSELETTSTAYWLDQVAKVPGLEALLLSARSQAQAQGQAAVVTIVVYDLPNRDCHAMASNGEFTLAANGAANYQNYIDQIAALIAKYPDVRVATIVEPDSLPNIVTNLDNPRCAAAKDGYVNGVSYAIKKLQFSNVSLYLDAAHGGWLGWPNNRQGMATLVKTILDSVAASLNLSNGSSLIRGFSTNVANYSPLHLDDPTSMPWYDPTNPAYDELTFISLLSQDLANAGITSRQFVIDTSRNGVANSRNSWGNWCNIAKAGIGARPTVAPAANIDAYLWVKIPGESDGTSDSTSSRFDSTCVSGDAATPAPEAGQWFADEFVRLLNNAAF